MREYFIYELILFNSPNERGVEQIASVDGKKTIEQLIKLNKRRGRSTQLADCWFQLEQKTK